MSNIQISLTQTIEKCAGKLIIQEKCSLCNRPQKNELACIRNEKSNKIICKSCVKDMSFLNLSNIIKDANQIDLNFK